MIGEKFNTILFKKILLQPDTIRELLLSHKHSRLLEIRDLYNGALNTLVINNPKFIHGNLTPERDYCLNQKGNMINITRIEILNTG